MRSIYVQIPAYRDSELGPTLVDLLTTAASPDALRVAVLWQRAPGDTIPDHLRRHPSLELIECAHEESHGCNWARAQLQRRWNGEPYTLLLDSHHRFTPSWDEQLIAMYEDLRTAGVRKPLITAYLPPYDPQKDPYGRSTDPLQIRARSRERGLLVYLVAHPIPLWKSLRTPIPAQFSSLHFVFTAGEFNVEIPHDEAVYFFGDEVVLALRAFTYGYDLFHPHYVIGWHLYDRTGTRGAHWEDHSDYNERNDRSSERLRDIFLGMADETLGPYRTLEEYESVIGDKLLRS